MAERGTGGEAPPPRALLAPSMPRDRGMDRTLRHAALARGRARSAAPPPPPPRGAPWGRRGPGPRPRRGPPRPPGCDPEPAAGDQRGHEYAAVRELHGVDAALHARERRRVDGARHA